MSSVQPESIRSAQRAPLNLVLDLTSQMLDAARNGDWDDLLALEERRRSLIMDTFSSSPAAEDVAVVASCINEILQKDSELICLAEAARADISCQLGDLLKSKKALKVYTNMADGK